MPLLLSLSRVTAKRSLRPEGVSTATWRPALRRATWTLGTTEDEWQVLEFRSGHRDSRDIGQKQKEARLPFLFSLSFSFS